MLTSCLRLGFARTPEKKGWGVPGLFGVLGWGHGRLRKWSGRDRAAGSCIPSKNVQITSQCETAQPSQIKRVEAAGVYKAHKRDLNQHAQSCSPVDVSGRRGSSRPHSRHKMMIYGDSSNEAFWISTKKKSLPSTFPSLREGPIRGS